MFMGVAQILLDNLDLSHIVCVSTISTNCRLESLEFSNKSKKSRSTANGRCIRRFNSSWLEVTKGKVFDGGLSSVAPMDPFVDETCI